MEDANDSDKEQLTEGHLVLSTVDIINTLAMPTNVYNETTTLTQMEVNTISRKWHDM